MKESIAESFYHPADKEEWVGNTGDLMIRYSRPEQTTGRMYFVTKSQKG